MGNNSRRSIIKKSGLVSAGLLFGSTDVVSADDTEWEANDVAPNDYIRPPSGGMTSHRINRSAESTFGAQDGTSYTSAGSMWERASELSWNSGIQKWEVDYHTWALACTGYELEDGTQGTEDLFRSYHRIIVQHDHSNQISTRPYTDVDWGVATIESEGDNLSPESAVANAANELATDFTSGVSVLHSGINFANDLNEALIDGDIDEQWYMPSGGHSRMGHYLLYDHTFPPYEDLGVDTISVSLTHQLSNSLYQTSTNYTGNREPTDMYDYTHTYYIGVPNNPENMSSRELRSHGIKNESSDEYVVRDYNRLNAELNIRRDDN